MLALSFDPIFFLDTVSPSINKSKNPKPTSGHLRRNQNDQRMIPVGNHCASPEPRLVLEDDHVTEDAEEFEELFKTVFRTEGSGSEEPPERPVPALRLRPGLSAASSAAAVRLACAAPWPTRREPVHMSRDF